MHSITTRCDGRVAVGCPALMGRLRPGPLRACAAIAQRHDRPALLRLCHRCRSWTSRLNRRLDSQCGCVAFPCAMTATFHCWPPNPRGYAVTAGRRAAVRLADDLGVKHLQAQDAPPARGMAFFVELNSPRSRTGNPSEWSAYGRIPARRMQAL